ncbi:MAG: hypothetical protein HYU64_01015 [Armatimonadetes bacterium]|nr:hypothetical protein [Armatimonadota bacterium]
MQTYFGSDFQTRFQEALYQGPVGGTDLRRSKLVRAELVALEKDAASHLLSRFYSSQGPDDEKETALCESMANLVHFAKSAGDGSVKIGSQQAFPCPMMSEAMTHKIVRDAKEASLELEDALQAAHSQGGYEKLSKETGEFLIAYAALYDGMSEIARRA